MTLILTMHSTSGPGTNLSKSTELKIALASILRFKADQTTSWSLLLDLLFSESEIVTRLGFIMRIE